MRPNVGELKFQTPLATLYIVFQGMFPVSTLYSNIKRLKEEKEWQLTKKVKPLKKTFVVYFC